MRIIVEGIEEGMGGIVVVLKIKMIRMG